MALKPRTVCRKTETTNEMPMSMSHCTFCVTRPRFEVRLWNSAVDSSGSLPARSRARMWRKNQSRTTAADGQERDQEQRGCCRPAGCRRPGRTCPPPTGPRQGCRRAASDRAAAGSTMRRLSRMIAPTTAAWRRNETPPADRRRDEAADQWPRRGADAAHAADQAKGAGPRLDVVEEHRREDVDGRDQQGRADALEGRVADDQDAETRRERGDHGADAVDGETADEAALAAPDVGQLAARGS